MALLRTWYYFRLYFSFSCSGYDLILIWKSHTLNYYSFSQKFLLKTETYKPFTNSLLVTIIAQFTAKTTNSKKAIYFLSLMSCLINKLKSHMFFTWKNFMFSDFTWKKNFCSRKWWGGATPLPPFSAALKAILYLQYIIWWSG